VAIEQKARPETCEFILAVDEFADEDDAALVRASAMFYILDGWEYYWPFPRMPKWLLGRYWSADLIERLKAVDLGHPQEGDGRG
jgi:hypothetical protein